MRARGAGVTLSVHRMSLTRALRRGLTVAVHVPARGRVALVARLHGKRIASRAQRVRAGARRLRLPIAAGASRRLRARQAVRVTVALRYEPRRGRAVRLRVPLLLRR